MATPTIIYCDPSIDANSGTGTSGDPYGRYGYMLSSMTFNTSLGNFLAIKQGTTIVGSDWAIPFNPTSLAQLTHVVWSGSGAFDPNADPTVLAAPTFDGNAVNTPIFDFWNGASHQKNFVNWFYFRFTNGGSSEPLVQLYQYWHFAHCEFTNSSGGGIGAVGPSASTSVFGCFFHDLGGTACYGASRVHSCYFLDRGTRNFTWACRSAYNVANTIFDINGGTAIDCAVPILATNNTLIQRTKGTIRDGIWFGTGTLAYASQITNNIFVGFQAALDGWLGTVDLPVFFGNSFYDNTADFNAMDAVLMGDVVPASPGGTNNEKLAEDPFNRTGSKPTSLSDFVNRFAYYRTKDLGLLRTGGYPFSSGQYRGAVPPLVGGGSGGVILEEPAEWI